MWSQIVVGGEGCWLYNLSSLGKLWVCTMFVLIFYLSRYKLLCNIEDIISFLTFVLLGWRLQCDATGKITSIIYHWVWIVFELMKQIYLIWCNKTWSFGYWLEWLCMDQRCSALWFNINLIQNGSWSVLKLWSVGMN